MKNNFLKACLLSAMGALTLGVGAFISSLNENMKPANAENAEINDGKHLYVRVNDVSEISVGDVVILVGWDGSVFDCPAGNPRFMRMEYVAGMNNDVTAMFADESQVNRLKVCAGIDKGSLANSFAFQCMDQDSYNVKDKYLTWVETDDILPHDKGHVGYYLGNIAFKDNIDGYSSWEISNDYDGGVRFWRVNEPQPHDTATWALRHEDGSRARLFYGESGDNLLLFKEIDRNNYSSFDITSDPTKKTYYKGEQVDLSGLEFDITIDGKEFHVVYDECPSFFNQIGVVEYGGGANIYYCGILIRLSGFEIIEEPNALTFADYVLVPKPLHDYRGTYVFAHIKNGTEAYILKMGDVGGNPSENNDGKTIYIPTYEYTHAPTDAVPPYETAYQVYGNMLHLVQNPTGNAASAVAQTPVTLVNGEGNKLYACTPDGDKYLSFQDGGDYDGVVITKSTYSESDAITIAEDGSIKMNGRTLVQGYKYIDGREYSTMFVTDTTECDIVRLYKKATDSTFRSDIDAFVNNFLSKTAADCVAESVQASTWTSVLNDYNALSLDEKAYFTNIEYIHNSNTGLDNEYNVVDRYDYIVAKYSFSDFMNRKEAGTWQNYYFPLTPEEQNLSNMFVFDGNDTKNYVSTIVIILSASISVGTVIYMSKKLKSKSK